MNDLGKEISRPEWFWEFLFFFFFVERKNSRDWEVLEGEVSMIFLEIPSWWRKDFWRISEWRKILAYLRKIKEASGWFLWRESGFYLLGRSLVLDRELIRVSEGIRSTVLEGIILFIYLFDGELGLQWRRSEWATTT